VNLVIRVQEPLSRHTAWRTGGCCEAFVVVNRRESLAAVIADCRAVDWKWTLVGAGTRSVFRDGDVAGAVIRLGFGFAGFEAVDDTLWRVGAATPMPAMLARCAQAGLAGLEDFGAIPGSVGASVALDPGWEGVVESVEVLHRGQLQPSTLEEARGGKRVITGVTVRLSPDRPDAVRRRLEKATGAPRQATPLPSSWYDAPKRGSLREVFKSVRLPMVRLRGVAIPEQAPELLVNLGGGTAADLALLHRSALERVKQTRGLDLESRVVWEGV
jgi:UDP-N-acetylmuramate dehydrogenase